MRREPENVQWTRSAASEPSLVPPIAGGFDATRVDQPAGRYRVLDA